MAQRSVAERVLDVLTLLVDHPDGMQLSEVARSLSMPKSATHRILATLGSRGFVEQPQGLEIYRLSMKLPALGFRYVARARILDICQPVLDRLAKDTSELVRLAVSHAGGLTWVAKAQGARWGLRYDPDMGSPVVLHATATGRAWLVTLPEVEAVRHVETVGFSVPERFGRQKVSNRAELLAELKRTRSRGYGLAIEEGEPGTSAVAMAVVGEEGQPAPATLSVAGPVNRMSAQHIENIIPRLAQAVAELAELWPIVRILIAQGDTI